MNVIKYVAGAVLLEDQPESWSNNMVVIPEGYEIGGSTVAPTSFQSYSTSPSLKVIGGVKNIVRVRL